MAKMLIVLISLFISGCLGTAYELELENGYYLLAVDTRSDMSLGTTLSGDIGVGVIDATVFAVGQNSNLIVVKQHPKISPQVIDKAITNYYIIPLHKPVSKSKENNYYGPMSKTEFDKMLKKLNEPYIDFDIVFKDLE